MAAFPSRLIATLRQSAWLDRDRIVVWCAILAGLEAAFLLLVACWQHGAFGPVAATSGDFVSFYAAGKLVLAGTPWLAYDQAAHALAEQAIHGAGAPYQFFFYPPVYLPLCAVLATLPYYVAFALFQIGTLVPLLLMLHHLLRHNSHGWLVPVLAFPAVFWTIGLGQNAFLTTALFAAFTMLLERRPVIAGVPLGLLCYKPHFGVLVPFALAAAGLWRTFFVATATLIAAIGLSVALFGGEIWYAYGNAFLSAKQVFASGRIDYAGVVTVFGAERLMGFAVGPAYALQAVASLEMVMLVAMIWRRGLSLPLRAATLLAATLLAVPVALLYDQMLVLLAVVWLVREAQDTGFRAWEKLAFAIVYVLALVGWPLGNLWHLPIGPIAPSIVLLLCVRRLWRLSSPHGARVQATP